MKLFIALTLMASVAFAAHPFQCFVNTDTDLQYFNDDDGSAGVTTDCSAAQATTCSYPINNGSTATTITASDYPVILRWDGATGDLATAPISRIEDDEIFFSVRIPYKFYGETLRFNDATNEAACQAYWSVVSDTFNKDDLTDGCYRDVTYKAAWNDVYDSVGTTGCGWVRDPATGVDPTTQEVTLTLDIAVETTNDNQGLRSGPTTTTVRHALPMQLVFKTRVTATSDDIVVYSPVRTLAAITEQLVAVTLSPLGATMGLRLFTSVQAPFKLTAPKNPTTPTSISVNVTDEWDVHASSSLCTTDVTCNQDWDVVFKYDDDFDAGSKCNFDGTYSVEFEITCNAATITAGDCPIDTNTDSVVITFTVASSDHCVKVVETVSLQSSLISCISDCVDGSDVPTGAALKDDFLDGQTAYFYAPTFSPEASLTSSEFHAVWLDRGTQNADAPGTGDVSLIANNLVVSNWANTVTVDGGTATPGGLAAGGGGHDSNPDFNFLVVTDDTGLDMAEDANEVITVRAILDVVYENAGQSNNRAAKKQFTTLNSQQRQVSASVGVNAPSGSSSSTAGSTSSTMPSMSVMAGGVVFLTMFIAIVALFVSRQRLARQLQSRLAKSESQVQLTTQEA